MSGQVDDLDVVTTYWCKLRSGEIVEHQASAFEGHRGHVRCVPIAEVTS